MKSLLKLARKFQLKYGHVASYGVRYPSRRVLAEVEYLGDKNAQGDKEEIEKQFIDHFRSCVQYDTEWGGAGPAGSKTCVQGLWDQWWQNTPERKAKTLAYEEEANNIGKAAQEEWIKSRQAQGEDLMLPLSRADLELMHNDPNFQSKLKSAFDSLNNRLKMQKEFDQQDKDIAEQQAKEKAEQDAYKKSIDGKTPFNKDDAQRIVNEFIPEMKKRAADLKGIQILFKYSDRWDVIITYTAERLARMGFKTQEELWAWEHKQQWRGWMSITTPIMLSWKGYLINNKKYLVRGDILITL